MKKILFSVLVVAVVAMLAPAGAHAQSMSTVVKIPFSFIVAGRVLPAGTYRVDPDPNDYTVLKISGESTGSPAVFVTTDDAGTIDPQAVDSRILFKSFRGQHFLWQVAIPGRNAREIALPDSKMSQVLAKLNLSPAEPALGTPAK